jgi:hypothetical protein
MHTRCRYTHSMQRTDIVDAMLNEDVEAAREGFKRVYYAHLGEKETARNLRHIAGASAPAWMPHCTA